MPAQRYRLVTRSDFDGLVCAVLLKKLNAASVQGAELSPW
jgi:hypothetical protein